MKRVPRGHPFGQGFEGRNALCGHEECLPERVPRETLLWSGCKGRAPLLSGETAHPSGVQGTALESPWRGMLLATYNLAIPPLACRLAPQRAVVLADRSRLLL